MFQQPLKEHNNIIGGTSVNDPESRIMTKSKARFLIKVRKTKKNEQKQLISSSIFVAILMFR